MIPESYNIKLINAKLAKEYIHKNHYSHGSHNGPFPCYGLFNNDDLIGVLMFATPCSEKVRSSLFGEEHKDKVVELHRLHIIDNTPKNTESWFIGKCISQIKKDRPQTWGIISFADPTEGHRGTIYQATNFLFCGYSEKATFYLDSSGRLRHPRQCGKNITRKQASEFGWTPTKRLGKCRYVYLLNRKSKHYFKLKSMEYPKNEKTNTTV